MITNKGGYVHQAAAGFSQQSDINPGFPQELIELYRFLATICINLHWSNFEGLEPEDVWHEQIVPYPGSIGALKQLTEDVGGLWPLLRRERRGGGSIEDGLEIIEQMLSNLLRRYPQLTFRRGKFSLASNVYCLNPQSLQPSMPLLGDHPVLTTWEKMVTPEQYGYVQKCIYQNGCWRRQLAILLPLFTMARRKIVAYL